ncbi:MAG: alcohol dehydrogenase catalytic domain-containing protein [Phycisphaerales bacterium]|nr:alcohol dehydrogenase catalytic domain-containing protein [Phycisphaerales bacterium]
MRSVRAEAGSVRVERKASAPRPGPGEALLRPRRVLVGSADIAAAGARGHAVTLGHQFVATVEEVNPLPAEKARAEALRGKRVVGSPEVACGRCDLCHRGLSAHCRERTILGLRGRDGCFADAFCLPIRNLLALPDTIDDDRGAFAWLLGAAVHAAHQIRIEGKPYITVLGDGRLGLLCAQVMNRLNASVRVVGRHESKLALCERWGVKHRLLDEAGRRADQDIVVEATGHADGLTVAMQMVRPRGKILLKTLHAAGAAADLSPIVTNEVELIGSRGGSIADAVAMLDRNEVDVVSLITRRAKLDDAPEALRAAAQPAQIGVLMEL